MKKGLKITLITILIILLVAGGAFAYLYLGTDMLKSKKQLFFKYIGENVNILEELIEDEDVLALGKKQETNPYTSEGEFKVSGETSKVTFKGDTDLAGKYIYRAVDVYASESQKVTAEFLKNDEKYGIKVEDIYSKYVAIENKNLKQFAEKLGMDEEYTKYIPDSIDFDDILNKEIFTKEEKKQLEEKYQKILLDDLTDNMFSLSEADGNKVYTLTLTQKNAEKICYDFLVALKEDSLIWNKVKELSKETANVEDSEVEEYINEIKEKMQDSIDIMKEDLEDTEDNDEGKPLKINVFVKSGKLVKTEISIEDEGKVTIVNEGNGLTIELFDEGSEGSGVLAITKNNSNGNVAYNVNAKVEGEEEFSLAINFNNIKSEQVEENCSLKVSSYGETIECTYNNTKKFVGSIEKKEFDSTNIFLLNEKTLQELYTEYQTIYMNLMKSEKVQKFMTTVMSMSMLSGNNDILSNAEEAKNEVREAEVKEKVQLAISSVYMNKLKNNPTAEYNLTLEEIVNEMKTIESTASIAVYGNAIVYYNNSVMAYIYLKNNNTEIDRIDFKN